MPMKFPTFRSRREAAGPENMWTRCPSCEEQLFNKQLEKAMHVCPSCGHHFRLPATVRLSQLLDEGTWIERDGGLVSEDPLGFVDQKAYPDRVAAAQLSTGPPRRRGVGTAGSRARRRDRGHGLRVHGRVDGRPSWVRRSPGPRRPRSTSGSRSSS
jgi:acetyl-CoA carboxylase beta subunit